MKCKVQPVWLVLLNGIQLHLCGRCISQLAVQGNVVTSPDSPPVKGEFCECKGCGKH